MSHKDNVKLERPAAAAAVAAAGDVQPKEEEEAGGSNIVVTMDDDSSGNNQRKVEVSSPPAPTDTADTAAAVAATEASVPERTVAGEAISLTVRLEADELDLDSIRLDSNSSSRSNSNQSLSELCSSSGKSVKDMKKSVDPELVSKTLKEALRQDGWAKKGKTTRMFVLEMSNENEWFRAAESVVRDQLVRILGEMSNEEMMSLFAFALQSTRRGKRIDDYIRAQFGVIDEDLVQLLKKLRYRINNLHAQNRYRMTHSSPTGSSNSVRTEKGGLKRKRTTSKDEDEDVEEDDERGDDFFIDMSAHDPYDDDLYFDPSTAYEIIAPPDLGFLLGSIPEEIKREEGDSEPNKAGVEFSVMDTPPAFVASAFNSSDIDLEYGGAFSVPTIWADEAESLQVIADDSESASSPQTKLDTRLS